MVTMTLPDCYYLIFILYIYTGHRIFVTNAHCGSYFSTGHSCQNERVNKITSTFLCVARTYKCCSKFCTHFCSVFVCTRARLSAQCGPYHSAAVLLFRPARISPRPHNIIFIFYNGFPFLLKKRNFCMLL